MRQLKVMSLLFLAITPLELVRKAVTVAGGTAAQFVRRCQP